MPILQTKYHVAEDKGASSVIDDDPESAERKYWRVRPGGNVTIFGLAKMRAAARAEAEKQKQQRQAAGQHD